MDMGSDMTLTRDTAIEVLKTIEDPELHVDLWTLGLIYRVAVVDGVVDVDMTYTTPFCPFGPQIKRDVEVGLKKAGFEMVKLNIVFTPAWTPSDELRTMLGL